MHCVKPNVSCNFLQTICIKVNMIKKSHLSILLLFFLFGCGKHPIESKLSENGNFWYIFHENNDKNVYENINYGYVFINNGNLDYRNYDFSTNKTNSFRMNDVKQIMKWKLINSKEIQIEHKIYSIKRFDKDTLILTYQNSNKNRILINLKNKNPRELIRFKL